jgi:hypothetical protein
MTTRCCLARKGSSFAVFAKFLEGPRPHMAQFICRCCSYPLLLAPLHLFHQDDPADYQFQKEIIRIMSFGRAVGCVAPEQPQ